MAWNKNIIDTRIFNPVYPLTDITQPPPQPYSEGIVQDWIREDQKETNQDYDLPSFVEKNEVVSLILLTRNRTKYFLETIESLHTNTSHPFELIVCDSDSREPGKRESVMQLLDDKLISSAILTTGNNTGMGDIWNRGVSASVGKYICTLNDDLFFEPGWLDEQVQCLKAFPEVGMINGSGLGYWHTQMQLDNVPYDWSWRTSIRDGHKIEIVTIIPGHQVLFSRELLDEIGKYKYELSWTSDMDLAVRAYESGKYLALTNKPYVIHRYDLPKTWDEDGGHGASAHSYPLIFGNKIKDNI